MDITVFGAGAMGTLYGARLAKAGHAITMVARGKRREAIEAHGLRVRVRGSDRIDAYPVKTVEGLAGHATDVVAVFVRRQHLEAVLPELAKASADIVMMVNVATGYAAWRAALGSRFFVGFPGAIAGFVEDDLLEYEVAPGAVQATVVGEPDGAPTPRARAFATALDEAGFPVDLRDDMEAWQRTHVAWITPFMLTAVLAKDDPDRFAKAESLHWWVDAMREGVDALRAEGVVPSPMPIRMLATIPRSVVVTVARGILSSSKSLRRHLVAAGVASGDEGIALAEDMIDAARVHGSPTPRLEALKDAVEAHRAS